MKKVCYLLLAITLLVCITCVSLAENGLLDVHCDELAFTTKIPEKCTAEYISGTGFQIYAEHTGYIPYVIVCPRPLSMKFNNPQNYLNNVFREYMENEQGDNMIGMNPAKTWTVGGKDLIGARYMYKVQGRTVVLLRLIEVRDDGDVEYTAKYLDGEDTGVMTVLEAAVRYYTPDSLALEPIASDGADTLPPETQTENQGNGSADLPEDIPSDNLELPASGDDARPVDIPSDVLIVSPDSSDDLLVPFDISGLSANTDSGVYQVQIADADKIMSGGYFTVQLYVQDEYPADQVEALAAGSRIRINNQNFTVVDVAQHDNGVYEIYPKEEFDGYLVLQKNAGGTYTALVNDWVPCTHLQDVKIMMPLPY